MPTVSLRSLVHLTRPPCLALILALLLFAVGGLAADAPDDSCLFYSSFIQWLGGLDATDLAQDVAVQGSYAYVAERTSRLEIVDLSDPESPSLLGSVVTEGFYQGVAIAGIYAYVAAGSGGLVIINISNPNAPQRVGGVTTLNSAQDVAVAGGYAYIADGTSGLTLVSIANPSSPLIYRNVALPGLAEAVAISAATLTSPATVRV
jgi:hypothetical protein